MDAGLNHILMALRSITGHDFSLTRRAIGRRLSGAWRNTTLQTWNSMPASSANSRPDPRSIQGTADQCHQLFPRP
jgi:hypothetical protein